ncbi:hypothetical protein ACJD0Z_12265 [Flavobacteriaceae bacterium M23B6Z8]
MKIEFKEQQKFTQWYLWLVLIGISVIPVFGIVKQIVLGEQFGTRPMSDYGLIIFLILALGLLVFFWIMRLETEIDKNEIRMKFFPFVEKKVEWKDIKKARIVKYDFVGYGIRIGGEYGTVYNTKGNKGLAIELKNGKKFVIGTHKEEELNRILKKNLSD